MRQASCTAGFGTKQLNLIGRYQNVPELNQFRRDAIFKPGVAPTQEMFPHYFRGNLAEVVTKIGDQFVEIFERAMAGPQTVIHGDYRIDNMLLPIVDDQTEIVAVDWQNTTGGKGPHDLAYFASQSESEIRARKKWKRSRSTTKYSLMRALKVIVLISALRTIG